MNEDKENEVNNVESEVIKQPILHQQMTKKASQLLH